MKKDLLPGWTLEVDEISNGVFKVILKNALGHKAEIIDDVTDGTIEKAKSYAFDIERQISKNWNLFLYNFCLLRLEGKDVSKNYYDDNAFGSWLVMINNNRVIYDGKDSWLIYQNNKSEVWVDEIIIKKQDLNYCHLKKAPQNLQLCKQFYIRLL